MNSKLMTVADVEEFLKSLGLIYSVSWGIQFDIMVGQRNGSELPLCSHNCTTEVGHYDCPAAISRTGGVKLNTLAPPEVIEDWLIKAVEGQKLAMQTWMDFYFSHYCTRFRIPQIVARAMAHALQTGGGELNLFGGEPGKHPQIMRLIRFGKKLGLVVNLTDTGRRYVTDQAFVEEFLSDPPFIFALSLDDMTLSEFNRMASMSPAEIRAEWQKIMRSPDTYNHGQKQKACEAMYVLVDIYDRGLPKNLVPLLNMVLWSGNIDTVYEMTEAVERRFPGTMLNPYTEQRALNQRPGSATRSDVDALERFYDYAIRRTLNGERFVKRLHFWLKKKAECELYKGNYEALRDAAAGHNGFRCYNPGSGRYLSIGQSGGSRMNGNKHPGGYPGCFWPKNRIVHLDEQVQSPQQILDFRMRRMRQVAIANGAWCVCDMPRLQFDKPNLDLGLMDIEADDEIPPLVKVYQRLTQEFVWNQLKRDKAA